MIWKYFYSLKSPGEHGTLYQLCNKLNRTNVCVNPDKDVNACEDFLLQVVSAHIVAAALEAFKMINAKDSPSEEVLNQPENIWMQPEVVRREALEKVCQKVVEKFMSFSFHTKHNCTDDQVYNYAQQVLSVGCFYMEFIDAIKEGDGDRVLSCWKYMLPIFLGSGRTNYSNEVVKMLYQFKYSFSPRLAQELLTTRFINVHGRHHKNIPADLHMEHLNKIAKDAIEGLGANKKEKAIVRVGRAIGTVAPVLFSFDQDNDVTATTGVHKVADSHKDVQTLVKELTNHKVFKQISQRKHRTFPHPHKMLHSKDRQELVDWVKTKL